MSAKWDRTKTWAVYGDGELGGLITFEQLSPWLGTAHCLFKPSFQGKGIAPDACRVALTEMFTLVGKLEFYVNSGNKAIGSMLVNLGAKREGLLEKHTLCGGKPTDLIIYGLPKDRFHVISNDDHKQIEQPVKQNADAGDGGHVQLPKLVHLGCDAGPEQSGAGQTEDHGAAEHQRGL
jgi:hypothetical protein